MGLDLVELVMKTEEVFAAEIPDEVAVNLLTPGDVIRYLHEILEGQTTVTEHVDQFFSPSEIGWHIKFLTIKETGWNRELISELFWRILVEETGIERHKFTDDSRFIQDMNLD